MKRVLLVDDEELTTLSLQKMIERSGQPFAVEGAACNGQAALDFLQEHSIDIAIVDIRMPVLDGIGFLREVQRQNNPPRVIILSAYRDFEYAQQALRYGASGYLLKPISQEKLMNALCETSSVVDRDRHQQEATAHMRLFREQRAIRQLMDKASVTEALPAAFQKQAVGRLMMFTSDAEYPAPFVEECRQMGWYSYNDRTLLRFVPDGQDALMDHIQSLVEGVYHIAPPYYLPSIVATCSNGGYLPAHLYKAYNECKAASVHYFYLSARVVIHYAMVHPFNRTDIKAVIAQFDTLNELVRLGNEEAVLGHLREIYYFLQESQGVSPQMLYQLFYDSLQSCHTVLGRRRVGDEAMKALESITLGKLQSLKTLDNLYTFFVQEVGTLLGGAEMRLVENDDRIVERTRQYCLEHYASDCSLDDIASNVHISKSYLSQMFKEHTGQSIWNYLTNCRMEKARELLSSGEYKAIHVGEQVGYKNPSHFGKIFKSKVGMSPKEYQMRAYSAAKG